MAKKIVRVLEDVHFDAEDATISLCTVAAASGKNEPYLLKSVVVEESDDVAKATESDKEVNKSNENNEELMTQEEMQALMARLEASEQANEELRKSLARKDAEVEAKESVAKYKFDEEVNKAIVAFVTEAKVEQRDIAVVFKALDAVIAAKDVEKEQAVAIAKSAATPTQNGVDLTVEVGHEEKVEKKATSKIQEAAQQVMSQYKGNK